MRDKNLDHGSEIDHFSETDHGTENASNGHNPNGRASNGHTVLPANGATAPIERHDLFSRCVRCGDLVAVGWGGRASCRCGALSQPHHAAHLSPRD